MNAGDDHVELAEQLVGLVEAAVLQDVDLDPLEHPERRHRLVQVATEAHLLPQPLRAQAAGHLEPRRVVGDRAVLMAQRPRGDHHLLDRAAAVGPGGMAVQITPHRGPHGLPALGERHLLVPQLLQVARDLPGQRLGDHGRRLRADAGHLAPGLLLGVLLPLLGAHRGDRVRRRPVRAYPEGVRPRPLQQEADLAQRLDRAHGRSAALGRGLSATVGIGGASITRSARSTTGGKRGSRRSQAVR